MSGYDRKRRRAKKKRPVRRARAKVAPTAKKRKKRVVPAPSRRKKKKKPLTKKQPTKKRRATLQSRKKRVAPKKRARARKGAPKKKAARKAVAAKKKARKSAAPKKKTTTRKAAPKRHRRKLTPKAKPKPKARKPKARKPKARRRPRPPRGFLSPPILARGRRRRRPPTRVELERERRAVAASRPIYLSPSPLEEILGAARARSVYGNDVRDVHAERPPEALGGAAMIVGDVIDPSGIVARVRAYEILRTDGVRQGVYWCRAELLDVYTVEQTYEIYPVTDETRANWEYFSSWVLP